VATPRELRQTKGMLLSSPRLRRLATLLTVLAFAAGCGDSGDGAGDPNACAPGPAVPGALTTYTSPGAESSACQPSTLPASFAAVSAARFAGAAACGTCLEIVGPRGVATATVVDVCPSCADGALDVSEAAWIAVADGPPGLATVTWRTVACPEGGPLRYRSCAGTNPYYLCLVADDHRFPLASVEVRPADAASFVALARDASNQWTLGFGAPMAEPVTVRATDVHGHVLTDTFASLAAGTVATGAADFPATCP